MGHAVIVVVNVAVAVVVVAAVIVVIVVAAVVVIIAAVVVTVVAVVNVVDVVNVATVAVVAALAPFVAGSVVERVAEKAPKRSLLLCFGEFCPAPLSLSLYHSVLLSRTVSAVARKENFGDQRKRWRC